MSVNERPDACAIPDGRVGVFIGGAYRFMSISAARALLEKISEAITKAEADAAK